MAILGKALASTTGSVIYTVPSNRMTTLSLSAVNTTDIDTNISVGLVASDDRTVDQVKVTTAGTGFTAKPDLVVTGDATTTATVAADLMVAASATVSNAGSGYAVGDTLTFDFAATGDAKTVLKVETVTSGAVDTVSIQEGGEVSNLPSGAVAPNSTSGSGSGVSIDFTFGVLTVAVTNTGNGYAPGSAGVEDAGGNASPVFSITYGIELETTDLIESNVRLTPGGFLERTGIPLGVGESIVVKADAADAVNCVVYGIQDLI